eukprot:3408116-Pyramimonas_sp.AAC.1
MAILARTEISEIECLHGSLRRLLFSMGLQTHLPSFEQASARWMSSRWGKEERDPSNFRNRAAADDATSGLPSETEGQANLQSGPAPRGGGGAWRAFIHAETRGTTGRPDLRALAEQYRQLNAERIAELSALGRKATTMHSLNPDMMSFGPAQ